MLRGSGYGLNMDDDHNKPPAQAFSDDSDRMDGSSCPRQGHWPEGGAILVLVYLMGIALLDALFWLVWWGV